MPSIPDQQIPSLNEAIEAYKNDPATTLFGVRGVGAARRLRLTDFEKAEHSLKVGEHAPDFTLPNVDGQSVTLSDLLKNGPAVVVFYRGDWCPFCNFALRAYQAILPQITQMYHGALVAISPQKPDYSLLTAQHKELTYPVLSDLGNVVAERYRVVWTLPNGLRIGSQITEYDGDNSYRLPMPATFVIDQGGIVRLASVYADWTKRTEPAEILAALRELKG